MDEALTENMRSKGKRILITGGAGFLGSNLCKRLLHEGNQVTVLDDFSTGSSRNLETFLDNPNFHLIEQDVTEQISVETDEIYHLACPASPINYQKKPVRTAEISFLGARSVLELARRTGARVLFTSSSEVYGEPLIHPQTEQYRGNVSTRGVRACYDEGKRISETLFFDYHRQYGVSVRVVRIFNTYGPNMDPGDGRIISNLITQAISGEDMTIYGDGNQTRSFCYVDDMVEALIRMMEQETFIGPVNLGNPFEITINHLAELIRKLTGTGSRLRYLELPQDDPTRRRPDISLAKQQLSWTPQISLEEGLRKTIAYYSGLKAKQNKMAAEKNPAGEESGTASLLQTRKMPEEKTFWQTGLVMGIFDLFHVGHLRLIRRAKQCCGYLRAAVLSDELAEQFKGRRPVIPAEERMEILRGLRDVDEVVLIDDTPSRLTEWERRPFDCFFSGDDYQGNEYWEWEKAELKKLGADIVFFPYTKSESSTLIRDRITKDG